jgi:hypothetical protein
MTSHRLPSPAGHRSAPTGNAALFLLLGALAALSVLAACGDDDTTTNNFIGVTDAEPPRLGPSEDGGAR